MSNRTIHSSKIQSRHRKIIILTLSGIFLVQVAFSLMLPWWHPDAEFRVREATLKARIAEHPERPLFLMIGSSRVSFAFDPELLPSLHDNQGNQVLCYNFGHFNAGPVSHLIRLKRLLRDGIKPAWVVVEILPPLCKSEWSGFIHECSWGDLGTISRYYPLSRYAGSFARNHLLLPWYRHRADLQSRYLDERQLNRRDLNVSDYGWWPYVGEQIDASARTELTDRQRSSFAPVLTDEFQISSNADKAYRELIELCRGEGINISLILMPEGESFRSWYSSSAEIRLQEFVNHLSVEYGTTIYDTRQWFDDTHFSDSHHLLRTGTREFTKRFEQEIIQPMISGRASKERQNLAHR